MSRKKSRDISGWLILNKPYLMTSTNAVSKIRYLFNAKKVGHAGTLDPLATGMLPIALGEATKTVPFTMDGAKTYEFTVTWGERRNTDDLEGTVVAKSNLRPNIEEIQNLIPEFLGTISQRPPSFSAIKVNGQRAYDLSRQGNEFTLKDRQVHIYELDLTKHNEDNNFSSFRIKCGKGTYIRSIARDMGKMLNCYGYISELKRINVMPFLSLQMVTIEKLMDLSPKTNTSLGDNFTAIDNLLISPTEPLSNYPVYKIEHAQLAILKNGNPIHLSSAPYTHNDEIACLKYNNTILSLGKVRNSTFYPKKVFQLFNSIVF